MTQTKTLMIDTDLYDLAKIKHARERSPLSFENYLVALISKGHQSNIQRDTYGYVTKSQLLDIETDSDWLLDAKTEHINNYLANELSNYTSDNYTSSLTLKWIISLLNILSIKSKLAGYILTKIYQKRSEKTLSIRYILYKQVLRRHKIGTTLFLAIGIVLFLIGQSYLKYASQIESGLSEITSFSALGHYVQRNIMFLIMTGIYFSLVITVLSKFKKNHVKKLIERILALLVVLGILSATIGYTVMDIGITIRMLAITMTVNMLSVFFIGFGFVAFTMYTILRFYLKHNHNNSAIIRPVSYKEVEGMSIDLYSIRRDKPETVYLVNAIFTKNTNYGGNTEETTLTFEQIGYEMPL